MLGQKRTATQGEKAAWGRSVRSGCGKAPTPYAHPMQVFVPGWLAGVFRGLALGIGSGAVRILRQAGDVVLGVGCGEVVQLGPSVAISQPTDLPVPTELEANTLKKDQ